MVKLIKATLIACAVLFILPVGASAQEANNKFGIHIIDENDLPEAAALVNSNGGQWGYVTLVIREDERDATRWQRAFDQMRRLKLIPIVRLATRMTNSHWEAPKPQEAVNWAEFLNSLNWPVKTRYIVLFNEPNHAKEWGAVVDPAGFAKTTRTFFETLKSFSKDFFVMQGALDLDAANSENSMEASRFFEAMYTEDKYIFTLFDGLASHSYPNPGFSGSPSDSGKTSIKGYEWEINYLKNFGMREDIPVFITETGWVNSAENLPERYKEAFEKAWSDPRIYAVTPFLLSYLGAPFDNFSWKNPETQEFYPQYYSVQSMAKQKGKPIQIHSLEFINHNIPETLVSDSEYSFLISLKNTGQSIWSTEDGFALRSEGTMSANHVSIGNTPPTEPGAIAKIPVRLNTSEPRGIHTISLAFYKDNEKIADILSTKFTLVSPPSINIFAKLIRGSSDLSLKMYDGEYLITQFEHLSAIDGKVAIESIKGVIPNRDYRFVLAKTFYLSKSRRAKLLVGTTNVDFGFLLPLDPNPDGKLDIKDAIAYSVNPFNGIMNLLADGH